MLDQFVAEMRTAIRDHSSPFLATDDCPVVASIEAMPREDQRDLVVAAGCLRMDESAGQSYPEWWLDGLQSRLMRRDLPFTDEQLHLLMQSESRRAAAPMRPLARALERHAGRQELGQALRAAIAKTVTDIKEAAAKHGYLGPDTETLRFADRLASLLSGSRPAAGPQSFAVEKPAMDWLGRDAGPWSPWPGLLALFRKSCPARPEERWLGEVAQATAAIDRELLVDRLTTILEQQGLPGHADPEHTTLRQFVWAASTVPDPQLAAALGRLAKARYEPGPADAVGNAAINALAEMGTHEAVGQLGHLKQAIRSKSAHQALRKAVGRIKETSGLSDADVEEMAVPRFELDADGTRVVPVGDHEAVIRVAADRSVALTWRAAGAERAQKTVPAAVKSGHARELASVRAIVRDIRDELSLQRRRIEDLMATDRRWELPVWRDRYAQHPVVGPIACGLIWRFETDGRMATGVWRDGRPVGADDAPLDGIGEDTAVMLWHPVDAAPGEVEAWRGWVRQQELRQPFKQAFRESYAPTPAELETRAYSNRFAAHFIREAQFAGLRRTRGWSGERIGMFDAGGMPNRRFEAAGLQASFHVDPVEGGPDTATGPSAYCSTDRVVFTPPGDEWEPLPIEQIPLRVFSEAMRDVDLFVSVSSIGADPNWEDRGAPGEMRQYWRRYLDSPLYGSAETRHAVLQDVLPRLKIAERCALDERHVLVRGNRLRYRINLRSGAAFAEPGGRHLCIVPGDASRPYERLLPFESGEDPVLATVLAKMFLLAADDQVADPSIRYQIDLAAHG